METLKLINGNKQIMTKELPKLIILDSYINETALEHIAENTELHFVKTRWCYEAQPIDSNQITRLFLTYNFKTKYYDNWDYKNTLMLKSDHHIGFEVDSICYECVKENNINVNGLKENSRLAC